MQDDQSNTPDPRSAPPFRKWRAIFGLTFVVSLLMLVESLLRWSDRTAGLFYGVFHILLFFIPLLIWSIIWVILILGLVARFRPKWRNRGTAYAPAIALALLGIITFPSPAERFERITDVSFPEEVSNFKSWHEGGGFHDSQHSYRFKTTPATTKRLIAQLEMRELRHSGLHSFPIKQFLPEFSEWTNPRFFEAKTEDWWSYYLVTDEANEQVFIVLSSI